MVSIRAKIMKELMVGLNLKFSKSTSFKSSTQTISLRGCQASRAYSRKAMKLNRTDLKRS